MGFSLIRRLRRVARGQQDISRETCLAHFGYGIAGPNAGPDNRREEVHLLLKD